MQAHNNRYGFRNELPEAAARSEIVTVHPRSGTDAWCTTSMTADAVNHCASVMAANMLLCFEEIPERDKRRIAKEAYTLIGPGPVLRGGRAAKEFLALMGVPAKAHFLLSSRAALRAIEERSEPCAFLVHGSGKRDWHWITAFGSAMEETGRIWFLAADGWHRCPVYFSGGAGSRLVFGVSFRVI